MIPAAMIDNLAAAYVHNRFMPVPPSERNFAGDGDFRAIGAEFLRHFVGLGGLEPNHKVLEIGCGIGRMALPLTQYLTYGAGSYDGIDVVKEGVAWCDAAITPVYGNFRFRHLDYRNPVYNPGGTLAAEGCALPFADARFDFVLLTSVVTHLDQAALEAYAAEIVRLLVPGGRCFLSLFAMNEAARQGIRAGRCRFAFDADAVGPEYQGDVAHPGAAVAFDEVYLAEMFSRHGLRPARSPSYGTWSGRSGEHYQDLCVLRKGEAR